MSIKNKLDLIPNDKRNKINNDLEITLESKFNKGSVRYIYPFDVEDEEIILPFAYAVRVLKLNRPTREYYPKTEQKFQGVPREEQKEVLKEAKKILSSKGSVMISAFPGFGKTCSAIKLSCDTCFKTLIIVNKIILMNQWEKSINKFVPNAITQIITTKSKKKDCDFYIINAQNIEKLGKKFFIDIGTVIVDEAHMIMAETLSRSLKYVYPRYLIGLSATPYRPDGLNILLELYFGKDKIIRELYRKHTVYKILSGFKPKIEKNRIGTVNWGIVLDSQAQSEERNELIIKLLKYFSERIFLILVKRISQGEYLEKRLIEEGEDVTSLMGSNQEFKVNSRILIGTSQKVGIGFDHDKLDSLIVAADIEEYFIQYLGRVFRTKESEPLILDIVDNYSVLKKHFDTRQSVYQKHGGIVKNFSLSLLKQIQ